MTALDPLSSALAARVKKYLRGTVFDPDQHPRHPPGTPTGGQFAPANTPQVAGPATPPAAPVKAKERTYDAPVKPVVVPPPPPPPPVPQSTQVFVPPMPAFTGKPGKAKDTFDALAAWQNELNLVHLGAARMTFNAIASHKKAAKAAMGNLTTWVIPSRVQQWEARTGQNYRQTQPTIDPVNTPELYGPREHYRRIYDQLSDLQSAVLNSKHPAGQPVWVVGEKDKQLPPVPVAPTAPPATIGQPIAAPQVVANFRPWEHDLPPFQAKSKESQRNIYNALGHMQLMINVAAASGGAIGPEYNDARDTARERLKGIKSLVGLMRSREQGKTVNPNWNSTVAQATYDHYMGIYNALEDAAQGQPGANHPPQLVWAVAEYGQPLAQIPGLPPTGTQVPPQGLKVQFQETASAQTLVSPTSTAQPVQQSSHGSGNYALWGGVAPRHELNLNIGPANPLTKFQPHPRAYQEAKLHPELNHGDAFDMDYDGPTGEVVTMYHGTKTTDHVTRNGLRWGSGTTYGQGIYATDYFGMKRDARNYISADGAVAYTADNSPDSSVLVVEIHTGRTIAYDDAQLLLPAWERRNPRLADNLDRKEKIRRAALEAGYSTMTAAISGHALVVLDPARIRILGAYNSDGSQRPLKYRDGGQLTLPPINPAVPGRKASENSPAGITYPLLDGNGNKTGDSNPVPRVTSSNQLGWNTTPPAPQQLRNQQVDAPTSVTLSDEGFKSLQALAQLRAKDPQLASKFQRNITDARQVVDTLLPIRVADADTITNMVRSGGLMSRDIMPKVAALLKQSTDPEIVEAGNKLDAVANSPLFNPSDKQLGITNYAQLAFGPPMMNLKNSGYGGTADFVLVGKRSILSRQGVMGGPTSISAYANGQPGATPDKARWDENVYDGETFKEVMAQRLAMGMGVPWVDGRGKYDEFKQPQAGFINSPDDLLLRAPLFTKETPEIYVPKFVDMSEFSHLLVDANATVDEEVMGAPTAGTPAVPPTPGTPAVPAVTAATVTRNNGGTPQVMDAATYVAQNNAPGGKLYAVYGRPATDAEIEQIGAAWYDGGKGAMRPSQTGLLKVNGAWEFVITPGVAAVPGTPGTPAVPGKAGRKTTRKVSAVKYFQELFAQHKVDIEVIPTTSSRTPHDTHSHSGGWGYTGNSPYIDIMYNKTTGQSI